MLDQGSELLLPIAGLQIRQGLYVCPMSSARLVTPAPEGGGGAGEFSLPIRSIPDNVFAGVVKGRLLLRLLDQIELLKGVVVDHRPLGLPRIDGVV